MLYYPGKVGLYLTCPHLSGQRPADGQVVHGEAQAGAGDRQLNLESKMENERIETTEDMDWGLTNEFLPPFNFNLPFLMW